MRAALLALVLAGCVSVTINVSFPQEKLDSAASSIEDLVGGSSPSPAKSAPEAAPAPEEPKKSAPPESHDRGAPALVLASWTRWLAPAPAHAQGVPELKVMTPEVKAAIESRRKRNAAIETALQQGCLGETYQGLVAARPGEDCPRDVKALAAAENADRRFIYKTLVEQNNMPAGDLARVQAAFAKARRDKVPAGTWIQLENGEWARK